MRRQSCNDDAADRECAHGNEHDPTGADARDNVAGSNCSDESRDGDRAELRHSEKR